MYNIIIETGVQRTIVQAALWGPAGEGLYSCDSSAQY